MIKMFGMHRGTQGHNIQNLTVEDALLIMLYANKNKPINGKLMYVKQVFLLVKEILPQLDNDFKFYPANFGPYSKVFAQEVNRMINEGIISVERLSRENDEESFRFFLNEEFVERARQSFNKLPDNLKFKIMRKRKGWDQLGYTGIVRFVYTKYPEYTIYSKIREEVNGN